MGRAIYYSKSEFLPICSDDKMFKEMDSSRSDTLPLLSRDKYCGLVEMNRSSQEQDSLEQLEYRFIDRFGNIYFPSELQRNSTANQCPDAGAFMLEFVGGFTPEEEATICQVFFDLSSLISSAQQGIPVRIKKDFFSSNQVLGAATAFYLEDLSAEGCGLETSMIWQLINTDIDYQGLFANSFVAGQIILNTSLSSNDEWHTLDMDGPGGFSSPSISSSDLDLYSVVLHEALHLLGFSSRIKADGNPHNGFFSIWDKELYSYTDSEYLINQSNSTVCCDDHSYNSNIATPQNLNLGCIGQGQSSIVFGSDNLATVFASYPSGIFNDPDALTSNIFSHINNTCDADSYVMHPSSSAGEFQRVPSATEADILCQLGYTVSGLSGGCGADCIAIANDDGIFFGDDDFVVDYQDIIENDFFPSGQSFQLGFEVCGNTSIQINNQETLDRVRFIGLPPSVPVYICYTLTTDCGACSEGQFILFYEGGLPPVDPSPCGADQNLYPYGDFEDFSSFGPFPESQANYYSQVSVSPCIPNIFTPGLGNSPDVIINGGSKVMQLGSVVNVSNPEGGYVEYSIMQLSRPIGNGCEIDLSIDYKLAESFSNISRMEIYGTYLPPCLSNGGPTCGNPTISEDFFCIAGGVNVVDNTNWSTYSTVLTNNSGVPINYILIANRAPLLLSEGIITDGGSTAFYIDNIFVSDTCEDELSVTPTIEKACTDDEIVVELEVCLTGDGVNSTDVTVEVNMPEEPPVASFVNGGDFLNGIAVIEGVSPNGLCENITLLLNTEGSPLSSGNEITLEINAFADNSCFLPFNISVLMEDCCDEDPILGFSYEESDCGVLTFTAKDQSGNFIYDWDFGDGAGASVASPVHDFDDLGGTSVVTLSLINSCGEEFTSTESIIIPACIDPTTFDCDDCTTATNLGQAGVETFLSNVLPPGGYSHQIYCVEGDLLIQQNEDYNFVNCTFRMKPGASIKIATGGQMIASESVFHGCGQMWRGIEVEEGGKLIRFDRNSVIDAQYAVYVHPSIAPIPTTMVHLRSNQFIANFVGVYVADEGAGAEADLIIAGNRFDVYASTDELQPPFSGQTSGPEGLPNANLYPLAGIYVQPMRSNFISTDNSFRRLASGVVIHENPAATVSFDAYEEMDAHAGAYPSYAYAGHALNAQGNGAGMLSAIDNEIKNCSHGIVSNQLSLEARDNMIDTVSFGIQAELPIFGFVEIGESGTAISNTIKAARIGVQVRAFDQNATVNIQRNSISTYSAGATAALEMGINLASTTVEDNLITVAQAGSGISTLWVNNSSFLDNTITLSDPTSAEAGMHFVFTRNCRVQGNTVNGAGTGGDQNYGMHIDFSPGNAYCNNTFDNTRYGTLVTGVSDAENNFKCNTFQEHSVGLQLNQSFFGLSRIGTQVHQSNCWSASSGGAVWDGVDFLTAQTYPFEVDPTVMACFLPPSVMPAQGWFDPVDDGGTSISCGTNTCESDDFNHESDDAHKIAQGQVGGGDYAASVTWMLQQYLYKRGYGKPIDSLTIQTFFNTHAHSPLGQFYNVDQQLKQLFLSTPTEVADMGGFLQQLKEGLALLRTLDQALLLAAESEWDSLLDNRHQTANELLPVTDSIAFAHSQIVHNRTNGMAALLTQNAGITAQAVYEINERFFNDALFRYLERGSTYLTSTELQRLQAIATQCPLAGGWPVFKARALLYVVTGQQGNYANACAPQQALIQAPGTTAKRNEQIQLYPNPARQEVMVQWELPLENTGQLLLFDTYGRLLQRSPLEVGTSSYRLPLQTVEAGLYVLRLRLDGEETSLKLIVNP